MLYVAPILGDNDFMHTFTKNLSQQNRIDAYYAKIHNISSWIDEIFLNKPIQYIRKLKISLFYVNEWINFRYTIYFRCFFFVLMSI